MSIETMTTVISAATLMLGFVTAFGWLIRRADAGEQRLMARIDRVGDRIDDVEREIVKVKVGVARLEGPERRLVIHR